MVLAEYAADRGDHRVAAPAAPEHPAAARHHARPRAGHSESSRRGGSRSSCASGSTTCGPRPTRSAAGTPRSCSARCARGIATSRSTSGGASSRWAQIGRRRTLSRRRCAGAGSGVAVERPAVRAAWLPSPAGNGQGDHPGGRSRAEPGALLLQAARVQGEHRAEPEPGARRVVHESLRRRGRAIGELRATASIDFLPFIDIFRRHNYTDTTRALDVESDKLMGVDGLLRLGGRCGVILTGELLIDDFDVHRMQQIFTGNGSQAFGLAMPRFVSPLLSLKLTATHMGIGTYTHGQLTNGITTRGRLLGNELGPDAKAFGARLTLAADRGVPARVRRTERDLQQRDVRVVLRGCRTDGLRRAEGGPHRRRAARPARGRSSSCRATPVRPSRSASSPSGRGTTSSRAFAVRTPPRSWRSTCCSSARRSRLRLVPSTAGRDRAPSARPRARVARRRTSMRASSRRRAERRSSTGFPCTGSARRSRRDRDSPSRRVRCDGSDASCASEGFDVVHAHASVVSPDRRGGRDRGAARGAAVAC